MQGIKRKRRCQNQCDQHLFSLKNLKNNSKYDIKLTFCPKYQRQPLPPQHTFAEYNNDGLFYTSAFALGVDKKSIARNLQKEMLDHQKLIKQNCQKYNQIIFPRPNSKHTTCSVCKQTYKNYYIHIFSDEHSEKIQASPYNIFVKQLCGLFKPLWDGCAEKADEEALKSAERERTNPQKKGSQQLNLDDILQQEDIDSNPSRISKYLQNDEQEEETVKEVVMKRPVRVYEPPKPQMTQKVYEDRQSRKKSINFAAFFDDEPKKKIINDHRQAISVSSKKTHKTASMTEGKSKQKLTLKKSVTFQDDDPFIIEYNARSKRKEKKSYYYIKKKERLERQRRQQEMALKRQNNHYQDQDGKKQHENQQQNQKFKLEQFQNEISRSEEQEYEKYLEKFHQDEKKNKANIEELKKTPSFQIKLFQQVEKKHYTNSLFQTVSNPIFKQKNSPLHINPNINQNRLIYSQTNPLTPNVYPMKKANQKVGSYQLSSQKKDHLNNEQKQQFFEKNKMTNSIQNQLPLHHKLRKPAEKENQKEAEPKIQRPTLQVFNEYEQKIREYQKQKDYNTKNKISQKINLFQEKRVGQISSAQDETVVKVNKSLASKELNQTVHYEGQAPLHHQPGDLKTQPQTIKYPHYDDGYYKKPLNEKDTMHPIGVNPMMPNSHYTSPHHFYPPYGYPMSPYAYPLHEPQKAERHPIKYGEARQNETYQRGGYYYGGWQHPYYMSPPPGNVLPSQGEDAESGTKNFPNYAYNSSKNDSKHLMYPPYHPYPGYPPTTYPPGYYPPPGAPFAATQRPQYPSHGPSNMRIPPQPNTSININFPMYLPPYHGHYQYQSNPQRYSGQQPGTAHSSQYNLPNQSQTKPMSSQYPSYSSSNMSNLPPYAEYQEYKKRENERKR